MRIEWFVACQLAHPGPGQQGTGLWSDSVGHAKRLGGSRTACGEWSLTMKKQFEVPFPLTGENCRVCLVAVSGERKTGSRRSGHVVARGA